ncbi:hypothetical protein FO519_007303 [Halicephalobus sp. NKZ332]|nr:hypothetical protein FO519_007303 [Halicephalobus sp. NKZ332]
MWLLTFHTYSHYIGSALCVPISLLLLYLIYFKTTKSLRPLSLVLLQTSVVDLLASLIFTFSELQLEVSEGFMFSRSPSPWNIGSNPPQCFHPALYGLTYQTALASMPIQCIYRYFLIFKKHPPPVLTPVIIYVLNFLFILPSAVYNFAQYFPASQVPGALEAFDQLDSWKNVSNAGKTFCAMKALHPADVIYVCCLVVASNVCFFVIIFTSIKIHKSLTQASVHFSKRTVELQGQLGRRLIAQSIIPAFCAVNIIIISVVSFGLTSYDGGIFLLIFIPYPYFCIVNPFSTILCIKPYRKAVVGLLRRGNISSSGSSVEASTHPQKSYINGITVVTEISPAGSSKLCCK